MFINERYNTACNINDNSPEGLKQPQGQTTFHGSKPVSVIEVLIPQNLLILYVKQ